MKILGWVAACIGGVMAVVNLQNYMSKSSEIQAWYYYRAELESARILMAAGIVILLIGIAVLLAQYFKNSKREK